MKSECVCCVWKWGGGGVEGGRAQQKTDGKFEDLTR